MSDNEPPSGAPATQATSYCVSPAEVRESLMREARDSYIFRGEAMKRLRTGESIPAVIVRESFKALGPGYMGAVLQTLRDHGPFTIRSLATKMGIHKATSRHCLHRLADVGIAVTEDGEYRLPDDWQRRLVEYAETSRLVHATEYRRLRDMR